jgi:hypothetical protein
MEWKYIIALTLVLAGVVVGIVLLVSRNKSSSAGAKQLIELRVTDERYQMGTFTGGQQVLISVLAAKPGEVLFEYSYTRAENYQPLAKSTLTYVWTIPDNMFGQIVIRASNPYDVREYIISSPITIKPTLSLSGPGTQANNTIVTASNRLTYKVTVKGQFLQLGKPTMQVKPQFDDTWIPQGDIVLDLSTQQLFWDMGALEAGKIYTVRLITTTLVEQGYMSELFYQLPKTIAVTSAFEQQGQLGTVTATFQGLSQTSFVTATQVTLTADTNTAHQWYYFHKEWVSIGEPTTSETQWDTTGLHGSFKVRAVIQGAAASTTDTSQFGELTLTIGYYIDFLNDQTINTIDIQKADDVVMKKLQVRLYGVSTETIDDVNQWKAGWLYLPNEVGENRFSWQKPIQVNVEQSDNIALVTLIYPDVSHSFTPKNNLWYAVQCVVGSKPVLGISQTEYVLV